MQCGIPISNAARVEEARVKGASDGNVISGLGVSGGNRLVVEVTERVRD